MLLISLKCQFADSVVLIQSRAQIHTGELPLNPRSKTLGRVHDSSWGSFAQTFFYLVSWAEC